MSSPTATTRSAAVVESRRVATDGAYGVGEAGGDTGSGGPDVISGSDDTC